MQSNEKRNLFFPQCISEVMDKIFDHPLTLVETPII